MSADVQAPLPIQNYVTAQIEGDAYEPYGWSSALWDAKATLVALDAELRLHPKDGDRAVQTNLKRKVLEQGKFVSGLQRNIISLQMFVTDERMAEAYDYLKHDFSEDWQWTAFAAAAWVAAMYYQHYRERLRQVREHCELIAEQATTLADLLETNIGFSLPSCFVDVATLLQRTDNHEQDDHNLAMWSALRWRLLGHRSSPGRNDAASNTPQNSKPRVKLRIVSTDTASVQDPLDQYLANLRYAWGIAPPFSALLRTLAREASSFEPTELGFVAAAVEKRQHNAKNEYIRAFAHLLQERKVVVTAHVQKAMAVTATTVLDDPDLAVSYDDVRKTLST